MNQKEKKILLNCGLFQRMTPADAEALLACLGAEEAHCEKNEILWRIGDPVRACAVVLSGALRAESVNASGEKSLMAYHTAGALVGDVLMATPGSVSPVYVTAAEETTLIYLPFKDIMGGCPRCCARHITLRENLISEIAQKFWMQRRRVSYLSVHGLRRRIAMYLTDESSRSGSTTFSVAGTREDLADLLGVNRSALCRELGRMKEEGLLDYYRSSFRILEAEKLAKIAG